ncbi:MAG TPA: inorganic phosphate transporter [Candidatus Paceibacterota bacterium]|nr:inorganic phosphate transporter [Verrucomicrobiota bacterium]HRZ45241.1 inorganic phosphate transporter [Candidatus Paceibacterota bacterium]
MGLVLAVIAVALMFEYINGFHDTANSIATVVSTKVLTPRQAVTMSAFCNLGGALIGTAVATTVGNTLVDSQFVTLPTLLFALLGASLWNLLTWWHGLPSSSSHALIGSLCGATLASADARWSIIHWSFQDPVSHAWKGLIPQVVLPMLLSPLVGLVLGFVFMGLLLVLLRRWKPYTINRLFGRAQLLSAAWMSISHGTNDAQKTMGILALTLFTATRTGVFDGLPDWLDFLRAPKFEVSLWIKVVCALTMAAGTAAGGWRIIATVGHKMVRLLPVHGFAAQTAAATVIQLATHGGIPLSTTQVISSSIMGVGATKRLSAVKWSVVSQMAAAWLLTLPATALMGYGLHRAFTLWDYLWH